MPPKIPQLSDAERDVLKTLWRLGPSTAREINEDLQQQGQTWAHTTVLTLLQRLEAKQCVEIDKSGFAHVFRAKASRDKILRGRVADLIDDLCDGAASPLVHALVRSQHFSAEEIAHFRKLLDDLTPRD